MMYIYSDSLDEMVLKSFIYNGKRYIWDDLDCVYYNVDTDEDFLMEVPETVKTV